MIQTPRAQPQPQAPPPGQAPPGYPAAQINIDMQGPQMPYVQTPQMPYVQQPQMPYVQMPQAPQVPQMQMPGAPYMQAQMNVPQPGAGAPASKPNWLLIGIFCLLAFIAGAFIVYLIVHK